MSECEALAGREEGGVAAGGSDVGAGASVGVGFFSCSCVAATSLVRVACQIRQLFLRGSDQFDERRLQLNHRVFDMAGSLNMN